MRTLVLGLAVSIAAGCVQNPCETGSGSGLMCTFAGTGVAGLGADGKAPEATSLYLPTDLTVGDNEAIYVLDWNNHRVRQIVDGTFQTVVGTGELGDAPEGDALMAALNHPTHVTVEANGRVLLSAWHNSKVMRFDPATGQLTLVAGNGKRSFGGDGGPANVAALDLPVATAVAGDGSLLIADQANARIRKVDSAGIITTIAGDGRNTYGGDGGPALQASLSSPVGQAASPAGKIAMLNGTTLLIADSGNNRVRRVNLSTGIITTFAGKGGTAGVDAPRFDGDGGPATEAYLARPTDVAVAPDGSVYIADTDNSCVRRVDTSGTITTVAGVCGRTGFSGDGEDPTQALLNRPYGIEVDHHGALYIADTYNHRIRVVQP